VWLAERTFKANCVWLSPSDDAASNVHVRNMHLADANRNVLTLRPDTSATADIVVQALSLL